MCKHCKGQLIILYLTDTAEDIGFALVITVSSHPQVHLLGVGVALEGLGDPQNGIWGSHLHT